MVVVAVVANYVALRVLMEGEESQSTYITNFKSSFPNSTLTLAISTRT